MYDCVLSTRKKINLENEYESNLVVRSYSNAALQESRPKAGFRGGQVGVVENHAPFFGAKASSITSSWQICEISHILSQSLKNMSFWDLRYLILKLWTKYFGLLKYNMLGLVVSRYTRKNKQALFLTLTLSICTAPTSKETKKGSLCFSLLIFLHIGRKIEENLHTEQIYHLGVHYLVVNLCKISEPNPY